MSEEIEIDEGEGIGELLSLEEGRRRLAEYAELGRKIIRKFGLMTEKLAEMGTEIETQRTDNVWKERLSASIDEYMGEEGQEGVILLYVPNTEQFNHYHIELTRKGANDLWKFLGQYLGVCPVCGSTECVGCMTGVTEEMRQQWAARKQRDE
jgi:hypothetical protein